MPSLCGKCSPGRFHLKVTHFACFVNLSFCSVWFHCAIRLITDLCECVCVVRGDQPHADHVQCAAWDASWHEFGQSAPWDPQQGNSHQFNDLRLDCKPRWASFLPQWVHTESTHSKDRTLLLWLNLFHTARGHLSLCWVIDKSSWSGRVLWPWQSSD